AAQASLFEAATDAPAGWVVDGKNAQRLGSLRTRPGAKYVAPAIFECKDGYLYFFLYGKKLGEQANRELVRWIDSEGLATGFLKSIDWKDFDPLNPEVDQQYMDRILSPIAQFFKQHTKKELFEEGLKRHIMLFPVSTTRDIAESAQLVARNYWTDLYHPELKDTIRYPGSFAKLNTRPCGITTRAPLIGEHNHEIYRDELGFSEAEIQGLKENKII
ncbi:MAG: CoA transferase, partial [Desulfobacterales bacterium]